MNPLDEYAFVISHDLKEPLRTIASYAELLARTYREKVGTDADDKVAFIVDAANRIYALVDALVAYSQAGLRDRPLVATDVAAVVRGVLERERGVLGDTDAVVSLGPLPPALADAAQVAELFRHLILNAVKFRGDRAPRIEIHGVTDGYLTCYRVADNGIGVDPRFQRRLFGLFQTAHGPRRFAGTGVGLAICRKIALRHGGNIWVESRPGLGSTFAFSLPSPGGNEA